VKGLFEKYLQALQKTPVVEKTEQHTDRSALEALLQALADEVNPGIGVQHEPKRAANKGAPDFKVSPRKGLAAYHGKGDHAVEAVRYSPKEEAIWINETHQFFKLVPQAVWKFYIGGYQVLDKYLKSRT
jgi:Type ISP C-terminal specificity domain